MSRGGKSAAWVASGGEWASGGGYLNTHLMCISCRHLSNVGLMGADVVGTGVRQQVAEKFLVAEG